MFGGLNRLLLAAVAAGVVLAAPPAALACGGGVSAVNVYKECLPTGGGGKATGSGKKATSGGSNPSTPSSGGSAGPTYIHISKSAAQALKSAGKDKKPLSALVEGYGAVRHLESHTSGSAATPTTIGSAFDLGSGPTILLIVLAGTAVLLLGASGLRVARQRRH